jgi:hypothetical protein
MGRSEHRLLGEWVVTDEGVEGEVESVTFRHDGSNVVSLVDEYGNPICDGLPENDVELFEREARR